MLITPKKILQAAGYEVLSVDERENAVRVYTVRFTEKEKAKKKADIEACGGEYDFDLDDTFELRVNERGFDGNGDEYIIFNLYKTGECWDVIYLEEVFD
ncbi:hypothetical protein SAMN02745945_01796 [Peptoclostridium litorale DSM 5388]|uniref:Uncharacterized protein n=1 Tax=Peptoclostridium litorale DSM 5388 TaxID=1121324 RepID=A0A069RFY5_PEPLI|nr:hypothetical protein [Peptoclostridium litorale]KDR95931.1 hypothetical protein CLIT_8c01000 [Peptoclostridium litorale DSM 5388]SIO09748.1 hypothetical protein SAMN02745945_01796 [Peptoclostridium litorale DSM 5388]